MWQDRQHDLNVCVAKGERPTYVGIDLVRAVVVVWQVDYSCLKEIAELVGLQDFCV